MGGGGTLPGPRRGPRHPHAGSRSGRIDCQPGVLAAAAVGAEESINVAGADIEILADLAGSVGVVLAALTTMFTGWPYADPVIAVAIGVFILPRAWRLRRQAVRTPV